jgi:hypothetical protein
VSQIGISLFLAAFLAFAFFGRESRRPVWWLLAAFLFADLLLNPMIPEMDYRIAAAIMPVKDIVLALMLTSIGGRFAYCQAVIVNLVGFSGYLMAFDLIFDSDWIYSVYEVVIPSLYATQTLVGSDGLTTRICRHIRSLCVRNRALSAARSLARSREEAEQVEGRIR